MSGFGFLGDGRGRVRRLGVVRWEPLELPEPLTPEAIEHITNGTVQMRMVSLDEIAAMYGVAEDVEDEAG